MFNGFLPARFLVVVCLRLVMEFYRGRGSARIDSASVELRLMSMLLLGRRHAGTSTQGGEITRVTRVFLPWAMMFNAFGVFIGCRKPLLFCQANFKLAGWHIHTVKFDFGNSKSRQQDHHYDG